MICREEGYKLRILKSTQRCLKLVVSHFFLNSNQKFWFLVKLDQTLKRDLKNALNRFSIYKIKTFLEGFCFPNLFWNNFQENLGLLKGEVLGFKPFYKLLQTGIFGQKMFQNSEYTVFETILMKMFCKYQNFSRQVVLKSCLKNEGAICKTFEIQDSSDFWNGLKSMQVLKTNSFESLLFSKTKHTSFFWVISNQEILKTRFGF